MTQPRRRMESVQLSLCLSLPPPPPLESVHKVIISSPDQPQKEHEIVPRRYTKQQQLQRRKNSWLLGKKENKRFLNQLEEKEKKQTDTPQCKLQKPRERHSESEI